MSNKIIRAAIEGRLKAWADAQSPAIPVFFENRGKAPAVGQTHLRGFLMPADTLNPSQGSQHLHYHGIYQVSIFMAEGNGTGDIEDLAGEIADLFKCPTTIQKFGINVNVQQAPAVGSGAPDSGFYMMPVTIKYDADTFD